MYTIYELAVPRNLKYTIHFTKNYLILENRILVFSYVSKTQALMF